MMLKKLVFVSLLLSVPAQAADPLSILAPATKGGGYDTLAQGLAKALQTSKLVPESSVYNIPGDGGVKGLQDFVRKPADKNSVVVFGLTTIGALNSVKNPGVSLKDLTPVARLVTDYEVIVVPVNSPIKTLQDVIEAYKSNPKLRFGGASEASAGQLFLASVLKEGGINLRDKGMNWVASSGNLQAIKAMMGGELDVASVSVGVAADELQAKHVRAIAVSSHKRLKGITHIPTAREQGIDAELSNWRGVFASSRLSEQERRNLSGMLSRVHATTAWRMFLNNEKQTDTFQGSEAFSYFVQKEDARIRALLEDLKLSN